MFNRINVIKIFVNIGHLIWNDDIGGMVSMDSSVMYLEYKKLLRDFEKTPFFGRVAVTHFLKNPSLKDCPIKKFYKDNALIIKNKPILGQSIDVNKEEHPSICGGVTEYLTKIKLAKELGIDIININFFDDITKPKYKKLNDEELAFALYEPDIIYRCGTGYTEEIREDKNLIINKAIILSNISLKLIHERFPKIESIDFHPEGHVLLDGKLAILGDSDLLINNCLIDFKTKKDSSIQADDRAQLFAYSINKFIRDGEDYDKVFVLNPRHNYMCELVNK